MTIDRVLVRGDYQPEAHELRAAIEAGLANLAQRVEATALGAAAEAADAVTPYDPVPGSAHDQLHAVANAVRAQVERAVVAQTAALNDDAAHIGTPSGGPQFPTRSPTTTRSRSVPHDP